MISLFDSVENSIKVIISNNNKEEIFSIFLDFCKNDLNTTLVKIDSKDLITEAVKICDNSNMNDMLKKLLSLRENYPNDYVHINLKTKNIVYFPISSVQDLILENIDKLLLYLIANERISRPFWKFYFKSIIDVFETDDTEMYENVFFKTNECYDIYDLIERCLDNIIRYNETDLECTYNFKPKLTISMLLSNIEKYSKFWYSFAMFYVHDVK